MRRSAQISELRLWGPTQRPCMSWRGSRVSSSRCASHALPALAPSPRQLQQIRGNQTCICWMQQGTVVIDESGEWLHGFSRRHRAQQTQCLRSPISGSPHPSPTTLQAFADRNDRTKVPYSARSVLDFMEAASYRCSPFSSQCVPALPFRMQSWICYPAFPQEIVRKVSNASPLPSPALFADFCRECIIEPRQQAMQRPVLKDTVVEVSAAAGPEHRVLLRLASGRSLTSAAVVYSAASSKAVRPHWWQAAAQAVADCAATAGGTLQLAADVSLPELALEGVIRV